MDRVLRLCNLMSATIIVAMRYGHESLAASWHQLLSLLPLYCHNVVCLLRLALQVKVCFMLDAATTARDVQLSQVFAA